MHCETVDGDMAAQRHEVSNEELREMARYFYALKDTMRLRIFVTLASNNEMTVTELARALHVSQPLVSFHLRPLRLLGLVQVRRAGREVYCSLNLSEIERRHAEFIALLDRVMAFKSLSV
ncbi:MAG: metalloregulator ArsR/SmtB family transcription factor [Chloroflexota bacterium]|nr:metalloregulator ArsR/SmtB family transcription factor [Chloroflexota bacterium]